MQPGVRVLGQPLARHAHHGGRARINLEAASIAALALDAAKRFDANVTKLTRGPISAAPKFATENYAATDTSPQGQANDGLTASPCALPHLAESRGVGIVFQDD